MNRLNLLGLVNKLTPTGLRKLNEYCSLKNNSLEDIKKKY